jgi:chromosome segregation ATPase
MQQIDRNKREIDKLKSRNADFGLEIAHRRTKLKENDQMAKAKIKEVQKLEKDIAKKGSKISKLQEKQAKLEKMRQRQAGIEAEVQAKVTGKGITPAQLNKEKKQILALERHQDGAGKLKKQLMEHRAVKQDLLAKKILPQSEVAVFEDQRNDMFN